METLFIIEIKQKLDKCNWNSDKKEILKEAVKQLRDKNYSDYKIRDLFQTYLIKEQTNTQMIRNNEEYLALLDEISNN